MTLKYTKNKPLPWKEFHHTIYTYNNKMIVLQFQQTFNQQE